MQEITWPVWGWSQRILDPEHIFCYSFGNLSFLCIRLFMYRWSWEGWFYAVSVSVYLWISMIELCRVLLHMSPNLLIMGLLISNVSFSLSLSLDLRWDLTGTGVVGQCSFSTFFFLSSLAAQYMKCFCGVRILNLEQNASGKQSPVVGYAYFIVTEFNYCH